MSWYEDALRLAVNDAASRGADVVYDDRATSSSQQSRLWFRLVDDGTDRLSVNRLSHWSEGFRDRTRRFDRFSKDPRKTFERIVREEIDVVESLQRRDRETVVRCGDRLNPAPTTFRGHRVGIRLGLHMGMTPGDMCAIPKERAGHEWRASQDGTELNAIRTDAAGWTAFLRCSRTRVRFASMTDATMTFAETRTGAASLSVRVEIPDTMLAAIPGMDLAQVIGHPAFQDHLGVSVRSAGMHRDSFGPKLVLDLQKVEDAIERQTGDMA